MVKKKETGFAALREEIKARPKKNIFPSPLGKLAKGSRKFREEAGYKVELCPECGHDLIGHYGMINPESGELSEPFPCECMEGCGCMHAFKRGTKGI